MKIGRQQKRPSESCYDEKQSEESSDESWDNNGEGQTKKEDNTDESESNMVANQRFPSSIEHIDGSIDMDSPAVDFTDNDTNKLTKSKDNDHNERRTICIDKNNVTTSPVTGDHTISPNNHGKETAKSIRWQLPAEHELSPAPFELLSSSSSDDEGQPTNPSSYSSSLSPKIDGKLFMYIQKVGKLCTLKQWHPFWFSLQNRRCVLHISFM
jgi:hypothetical protein